MRKLSCVLCVVLFAWPAFAQNGSGVTTNSTQRVTIATDDGVATDINDSAANLAQIATDIGTIKNSLVPVATADQIALTTGDQMMAFGSTATPTAVSADGDAVRVWADLNGRLQNNMNQWGGTAAAGGSGTITAGSPRVTIATDDPVNDFAVKGDANMVAHDAADAGNPLKIGFKADSALSDNTLVSAGDRTDAIADLDGALLMRPYGAMADRDKGTVGITDGSSTAVVAAEGAGVRFCATTIVVSNSSATNVTVDIRDGTAGSVLMTIPAAANMGGGVVTLPAPLCTTANTALAADPSASATTVNVSAVGFKTKL